MCEIVTVRDLERQAQSSERRTLKNGVHSLGRGSNSGVARGRVLRACCPKQIESKNWKSVGQRAFVRLRGID
jgi:hypothetical protein